MVDWKVIYIGIAAIIVGALLLFIIILLRYYFYTIHKTTRKTKTSKPTHDPFGELRYTGIQE